MEWFSHTLRENHFYTIYKIALYAKEVIWGNVSNRSENTYWISQSRLLSIVDMKVSQIYVSFFFTNEGENHLDKVEMLEF